MKIKVLFFMQSLGGGGAERTVINIVNNLDKNKFNVLLVVGNYKSNAYSEYLEKGIKMIDLGTPRLRNSFIKLRRTIVEEKPDIVFTTVAHNNIMTSLVSASIINNRPKLVVREATVRSVSEKVTILKRVLTRFCYNKIANGIIALSNGVRDDLITNFGINKEKIQVIYNPVDIELIDKLKKEAISEVNFYENEKKVIAVGRLVESKDYPTLLKAFKIVCQRYNAKLLIAGIGYLEKDLKQMADDLGLKERVIFKGFLKNPYKYMHNSDVFILTSKWEGFGHVIVEAMASEVPVISSNCKSGPEEIITNNVNGKMFEVGDYHKAAELILDSLESDNKELIINAKIRAKDFDAKKIVKQYEELFKSFVQ